VKVAQAAHGRGGDHGIRGREAAKQHVEGLLKNLNKFEHARWNYNPKDTRGQGNMGKVNMRSPYGFDKDSGREGSERGRPIREPEILDLAALLTLSAHIDDPWYLTLLQQVAIWQANLEAYDPARSYFPLSTIQWYLNYWQNRVATYVPPPYDKVWVGDTPLPKTIDVSLDVNGLLATFEGTNLLLTLTLTSINDYTENFTFVDWSTRTTTEPNYYGWLVRTITYHYDAGQVAAEYTQEVTLTGDGTYTFSYTPPEEMSVGPSQGGYFELGVTVTEPISGATYTWTYDRQIRILRCPYGIVYDKVTGKAIVGATVTIHNADGSIVALDKGANPNVSNPQTTDATGRYNAKLAVGKKYYLTVKATGYEEYKSPVFSERWHIVREDVGLTRAKALPTSATAPLTPTTVSPAEPAKGATVGLGSAAPSRSR
jgi:hypothetical protein